MREPVWVDRLVVELVHGDQLREHGGLPGIRDENALEAALARPQQKWHYEKPDLATLAAAYAYGLCQGHPFRDGNKRVAFVTMMVFLGLNGRDLEAQEADVVALMLSLASGKLSERELANWLTKRLGRSR
jgi:death-on-curing protein